MRNPDNRIVDHPRSGIKRGPVRHSGAVRCPVCGGGRPEPPCEFCNGERRLSAGRLRQLINAEAREVGSLQAEVGFRMRRLSAWRGAVGRALAGDPGHGEPGSGPNRA